MLGGVVVQLLFPEEVAGASIMPDDSVGAPYLGRD